MKLIMEECLLNNYFGGFYYKKKVKKHFFVICKDIIWLSLFLLAALPLNFLFIYKIYSDS